MTCARVQSQCFHSGFGEGQSVFKFFKSRQVSPPFQASSLGSTPIGVGKPVLDEREVKARHRMPSR